MNTINLPDMMEYFAEMMHISWNLELEYISIQAIITATIIASIVIMLLNLVGCFFGRKLDKVLIGLYMFVIFFHICFAIAGILCTMLINITGSEGVVVTGICIGIIFLFIIAAIAGGVFAYKLAKKSDKFYKVGIFLISLQNTVTAFFGISCSYIQLNPNSDTSITALMIIIILSCIVGLIAAIISLKQSRAIIILSTSALYGMCVGLILTFIVGNSLFGKAIIPLFIIAGIEFQIKSNGGLFEKLDSAHSFKRFTPPKIKLIDDVNSEENNRFCINCGHEITDLNIKFCTYCGKKL